MIHLLYQIITSCAGKRYIYRGRSRARRPLTLVLLQPFQAGLYPDQPLLWRPYKLIEVIQTNEGTPGARAALFFLALTFLFSQWAVNVSVFSRSSVFAHFR